MARHVQRVMEGNSVLRILLLNVTDPELVHTFRDLRFVSSWIWDEELAAHACKLIPPDVRRECGKSQNVPSFALLFDRNYRYAYRFSQDYRNYYCPYLCGETITSCRFLTGLDKYATSAEYIHTIQIRSEDRVVILEMRKLELGGENPFLEFLPDYDMEYFSSMCGRVIQGLMIAEDYKEGTYFFQTRCGLQFPFFVDTESGYLRISSNTSKYKEHLYSGLDYDNGMDIF